MSRILGICVAERYSGCRTEEERCSVTNGRAVAIETNELLDRAIETLKTHWATRKIAAMTADPGYDRRLAARVCGMLSAKCMGDLEEFDRAVHDLIAFSEEFVRLQMELDATGHYRYASFEEARTAVYDNEAVMNRRYLNGLFLSIAFWANHTELFHYFSEEFCTGCAPSGRVLEVPIGTGIYLSEFMTHNAGWNATGFDISDHAVSYAGEVMRLAGFGTATISKADIFTVSSDRKYDRIICGELLEHLEQPEELLRKLAAFLAPGGKMFLTTAIWAASLDHIFLYRSTQEARDMIGAYFTIESERALAVLDGKGPEEEKTPVNYACIVKAQD